MSSLVTEKLSVSLGGKPILKEVSLHIKSGEKVALIGPSGSGKTTLIRALSGLIPHESGSFSWSPIPSKSGIGFVFQQFQLIQNLTVLNNVLLGSISRHSPWKAMLGIFKKSEKELATKWLKEFGLENKATVMVRDLSGGQQQRVALARALTQTPRVLLADEPASALDIYWTKRVYETMLHSADLKDTTVIVNSHDLVSVKLLFPRVIALREGNVVFDGDPKTIHDEELAKIFFGDKT